MKKYVILLLLCLLFPLLNAQTRLQDNKHVPSKIINTPENFKKLLDSSNTFYEKGEYTKSLELNTDILNMAYALSDPYYIHQGYRYLAYDYLVLNDTLLALENFKKSEHYAKLAKNDTATALTLMDLANVYSVTGRYPEAIEFHKKSIQLFKKIGDAPGLAKAHYNMACTVLEAENPDMAYWHIIRAKRLNEFEGDSPFAAGVDNLMGEYYLKKGNYEKANLSLLKAIKSAKRQDLKVELENGYYFYSQSLYKQKRYKEAYEAFEMYDEYSDENSGIYTSQERYAITEKIQLEEYRKEVKAAQIQNELQQEIVKNKSNLNTLLFILLGFFLLLMIMLFFAYRHRKKLITQLEEKNRKYIKASREAKELAQAKSRFFSTVSHELRTPLYGVVGLSTLLLEDESLKKHEKDIKTLKFSADYLLSLINNVLKINKIDSDSLENENSVFDLKELMETITSSFEYMKLQNDNKVHVEVSADIPKLVKGNSVRLSQILMNLIGNAFKFTRKGNIHIMAVLLKEVDGKAEVKFTIMDSGIGIPENKHKIIFEEFSQGETMNYNYHGSGLGLPIVKKLLALSGSTIHLSSEEGKGATFSFVVSFELLKKKEAPFNLKVLIDTKILKGKRILIVEDNHINQIVTQRIVEKHGVITSIAENGLLAVSMLQKENFDLVLMDINMPVKNGVEASREIREFNRNIPIIALTAVEIEEMHYNIFDYGMNDIIVKPYDINKFLETLIRNLTERPPVDTSLPQRLRAN